MKCDEVQVYLPDYLAGEADAATRTMVDSHLAGCAACRADAAAWEMLGRIPDEQPSPALKARVDAMIAAYRQGAEHAQPARKRFSFSAWLESWWPYNPAFQFGIAMACLAVGLTAGHLLTARHNGNGELAQLRQEVQNTRQMVALSLLQQQSASDRLRGVTWSSRMEGADAEVLGALLRTLNYDSSVDVRLAAADALRRYGRQPAVRQGLIDALRRPQSPLVQIAIIDALVELREREAVKEFERLAVDREANEAVRQRADWGVQQF